MNQQKRKYRTEENWYLLVLILTMLGYLMMYVRTVIPPQTGWWHYYGMRLSKGDILYKDIRCYLQPYFPFVMQFLYSIFGSNLFNYIVVGIIMRLTTVCVMYRVMLRITKPVNAWIAVFFGMCVTTTYLMDQVFDYNPVVLSLTVFIAFFYLKYIENKSKTSSYVNIIMVGLLSGALFMIKQSTGVFVLLFGGVYLIYYCHKQKISIQLKNYCLYGIAVLIAILPGYIYIFAHGIFPDYINSVFSVVEAKGNIIGIFSSIFHDMVNVYDVVISGSLLIIVGLINTSKGSLKSREKEIKSLFIFSCILVLSLGLRYHFTIVNAVKFLLTKQCLLILSIVLISITVVVIISRKIAVKKNLKDAIKIISKIVISFGLLLILLTWRYIPESIHNYLYNTLDFFNFKRSFFVNVQFYIFLALSIRNIYNSSKNNESNKNIVPFFVIFLGLYLAGLLSAIVEEIFIFPIIAYNTVYFFNIKIKQNNIKNSLIIILIVCISMLGLSQKLILPYTWHGFTEPSAISNEPHRQPNIKGLEGFILSETTCETYESIIDIIYSNTTSDDTVYQFPHIPLFNVLTERKITTTMPINYFDVCSDELALQSLAEIQKAKPKVIIWDNLGEGIWQFHERIFRNGNRSGQREIENYYTNYVKNTYDLKGSYPTNMYEEDLEVWVRKSNADLYDDFTSELTGKGTIDTPYLIRNTDDFNQLKLLVNIGFDFKGIHFQQMTDIDFKGKSINSIGKFESDQYFSGVYNGNGHVIKNFRIYEDDNVALFTSLGGIVMNLGVENAYIKGACAASIVSHSVGENAMIINCYSASRVKGDFRAGGIADNFQGTIINCWSEDVLEADETGAIVSYDANEVSHSYSSKISIVNSNYSGLLDFSAVCDSRKDVIQRLNDNVSAIESIYVNLPRINRWRYENNKISMLTD